jgi:hypothetical protein
MDHEPISNVPVCYTKGGERPVSLVQFLNRSKLDIETLSIFYIVKSVVHYSSSIEVDSLVAFDLEWQPEVLFPPNPLDYSSLISVPPIFQDNV